MIRVYVAGPLHGSGKEFANIRTALNWGSLLWAEGILPFVPHLYSFWNFYQPATAAYWLSLDFAWLDACDALLRLPGESPGSDMEVARMTAHGRPVFPTAEFEALVSWAKAEQYRKEDLGIVDYSKFIKGPVWVEPSMVTHVGGQMLPNVCTDPTKMNGYCDQWGGSDFPCTD
jgi:hypothetical protein